MRPMLLALRIRLPALAFGALLLAASAGCTDALTAADAKPFQACAVDQDCVGESLGCSGSSCGSDVAVARNRQVEFEQLRGCWPSTSDGTIVDCFSLSCVACVAGTCTVSSTCGALNDQPQSGGAE
jgi:hypothetical protein